MVTQALAVQPQGLSIENMGSVFVKSGFFADAKDQAQAIVKIMAGQELGLSPIASMTGVYIVKGRPSLGANLIAACIKNSGRYNYKVITLTDTVCEIDFFERFDSGQPLSKSGTSKFTIEDAKRAGTMNTDKFPRNMLFARAMSNGAKWYCASIFAGGVYTPDELGANVVYDDTGEITKVIDTEIKSAPIEQPNQFEPEQPPETQPEPPQPPSEDDLTRDYGYGMSLNMAMSEYNSKNVAYGSLETDDLTHMLNAMLKLAKDKVTEDHKRKIASIKTILAFRNPTK